MYNPIYCKLVEDTDDILGIIAYSFYKQKKLEFVRAFLAKESRPPTDAELEVFYLTANGEASLSSYRTKAEALSLEFLHAALAERIETLQEESERELMRRMESLRPSFWAGVLQNIIASVSFVVVIGAILFIAWSVKFGPTDVLKQITGYEIQAPAGPAAPTPSQ